MADEDAIEVWQVFARELQAARKKRHWSVRELADRIEAAGFDGPSAARISQIEAGGKSGASEEVRQRAENVRLREVVAISVTLGPALLNLLAPTDEENGPSVWLGHETLRPLDTRKWLIGTKELPGADLSDASVYWTEHVPPRQIPILAKKLEERREKLGDDSLSTAPLGVQLMALTPDERSLLATGTTAIAVGDVFRDWRPE